MLGTQWVPFIFILLFSHSEIHIIQMLDLLNGFFNFLFFPLLLSTTNLFVQFSVIFFQLLPSNSIDFFLSAILVLISKSSLLFSECLFFTASLLLFNILFIFKDTNYSFPPIFSCSCNCFCILGDLIFCFVLS